jgi:hypothetical protein
MNQACSNTQKALYTITALTESEQSHLAECQECQALESSLRTVDAIYMVQEETAPASFARVMVAQVKEREAARWKIVKGAVALRLTRYRKWIALGATCCLALIVVMGYVGAPDPNYRTYNDNSITSADTKTLYDFGALEGSDASLPPQPSAPQLDEARRSNYRQAAAPVDQLNEAPKGQVRLSGKSELQTASAPQKIAAFNAPVLKRKEGHLSEELSSESDARIADSDLATDAPADKLSQNSIASSEIMTNGVASTFPIPDTNQPILPPVTYLDPNGYWENTYIPGSPAIPVLLESLHKTIFPHVAMDQILNTSGVFMIQHPVDPPLQGALGLAAHTDLPFLDKPGRVLLQVTIQGTDRAKGNRPPLTIVVVIPNSSNIPAPERQVIQDILHALEAERRVDDHIAILTEEVEVPVPFAEFRYGTLELFLKKLQQGTTSETFSGGLDALYSKASTLALGDEGTQLRERVILTIGHSSTSSFEPAYSSVDSHVLKGGVASVLALNDNVDLMRLSARGQGSYRVLNPSLPAEGQIRAELESYGAVVARALRLNVQLQPGVKLKEIIGSNKLSAPEVEREKAIEVATDRRLAQSLGIEADRGDDDPGIQILIPRFMSGDSHVVILDLFVEHAGQVADISLKSKDLVLMRNETLHASAALPPYREEAGEINTIIAHNEYAQRLATVIRMVRTYSEQGNLSQGVALLQSFAQDLENYVPPSNEKSNTTNLVNNYVTFLQAMIASSQQGNFSGVREAVNGSLDVTSSKILGNPIRRNK